MYTLCHNNLLGIYPKVIFTCVRRCMKKLWLVSEWKRKSLEWEADIFYCVFWNSFLLPYTVTTFDIKEKNLGKKSLLTTGGVTQHLQFLFLVDFSGLYFSSRVSQQCWQWASSLFSLTVWDFSQTNHLIIESISDSRNFYNFIA